MRTTLPFLSLLFASLVNARSLYSRGEETATPVVAAEAGAVNCTSYINYAKLTSSVTYLTLQGTSENSNEDCFAPNVTSRPASIFHVSTRRSVRLLDTNNVLHKGTSCNITVPEWYYPIADGQQVFLYLPLTASTIIECDNSPVVQSQGEVTSPKAPVPVQTPSSSPKAEESSTTTTTTTTTSTTKKAEPTPTTTSTKKAVPTTTAPKPKPTTTKHKPSPTTTRTTTRHTTTTSKKPKPTEDTGSGGSGGGSWINGKATFFTPNQGACGWWDDDDSMIVALGPAYYGNMNKVSKYCGQRVEVEGPRGNKIVVKVADACPPCEASHIDLSPAAFGKLGEYDTGILKVNWRFLD